MFSAYGGEGLIKVQMRCGFYGGDYCVGVKEVVMALCLLWSGFDRRISGVWVVPPLGLHPMGDAGAQEAEKSCDEVTAYNIRLYCFHKIAMPRVSTQKEFTQNPDSKQCSLPSDAT